MQTVHLSNLPTFATNLPSDPNKRALTSSGSSTGPTATISNLSDETKKTLLSTTVTIGRSRDNQLVVDDLQVSSHHAEIRPTEQGYVIADLNSANGTFVNGQRLVGNSPRPLYSNDKIDIGNTTFVYNATGSSPAAGIPTPPMVGPAGNNLLTGNTAQPTLHSSFPHDAPTVVRPVLGASSPHPMPVPALATQKRQATYHFMC